MKRNSISNAGLCFRRWSVILKYVLITITIAALVSCGTLSSTYLYRAITDNCNCEEYRALDREHRIEYRFRAHYRMRNGLQTTIEIEVLNKSSDTLYFDLGTAKISSRNISYQYNNKFIPLPHIIIPPLHADKVRMTGSDVSGVDDWNKIAGEQVSLTLQGIRLGERTISPQTVMFIPENPNITQ